MEFADEKIEFLSRKIDFAGQKIEFRVPIVNESRSACVRMRKILCKHPAADPVPPEEARMSFPRIARLTGIAGVAGVLLVLAGCAARPWRSPRVRRVYVEVEKRILAEDYAPETGDGGPESPAPREVQPLPGRVLDLLGPGRVDYPGAVA